jgi:predicted Rossmann fold nucleotide-binding protein DprA/Smf involved in DNA uptake
MKLLIVGSRSISSFDLTEYIPQEVSCIISGGARGVDTLAEEYADKHRLSKIILRPQYARYGKGAPLYRNEEAVSLCDRVLVIWDGVSRGTQNTISLAKKANKPITLITLPTKNQ